MNLKRYKKKNSVINKIIFILILLMISIIYILKIFNDKALPQFISYSEIETKKIVSNIISSTIIDQFSNNNIEDILITTKDSSGNIQSIDFNSNKINKLLVASSKLIEKNLKYLEKGEVDKLNLSNIYDIDKLKKGIIYELPSGIIFNNTLLNNILPKIPIRINLIGNVFCKLSTDITDYGINNALIKININVEAEIKILIPFVSSNTKLNVDIPILMKVIEGKVPSYYFDGYLNSLTNG